jgi:hypothetical protein
MSTSEHEYRICDMCLHYYTPRIQKLTGAEPKVTLMPNWDGRGCDFDIFAFPANKTVRLPIVLVEGQRRVSAPQIREVKPLKPVEARVFEALSYFIGKNPLKRISERLFAQQRQGSKYLETLVTRFTTMLDEE